MKMNANEVVESYVTDVALQLPRKQRNDVAFELRALINEGLQDRAEDNGRAVDVEMAIEFLCAFGRPEEVAARYRPALTIIDPADGQRFLRATVIGLLIIWSLGLLKYLQQPIDSQWSFLSALGQWWFGVVVPSLWWPGLLVVGFAVSSWVGQRWPQTSAWKPRAGDRIRGGRVALVMGIIGIVFGLFVMIEPRRVLDFFWEGQAAPAAYEALTYTESFLQLQALVLFALIMLNIPLFIAVLVKGRWTTLLRRIEAGLALATCATMVWTVMGGPIFMTSNSGRTIKFMMFLIVIATLVDMLIRMYRRVRPTPNRQPQMQ